MENNSIMSPPPSSSSSMSFPIVIVAVVGILGTAAFLLIYYVFIIKCCLNIRGSEPDNILRRRSFAAPVPIERRHGLDRSTIRAIPTVRYSSAGSSVALGCAVCLLEFREGERLRRLNGCGHGFHIECIDTWLETKASCPLCRAEVRRAEDERVVVEVGEKWAAGSMGDECVEVGREKDEIFAVQAMRRSVSMDSAGDRKMVEAVQEALRRNPELLFREEEGGGGGGGGGMGRAGRRLFIAFGGWRSGRSSRGTVQPVETEV